MSLSEDGTLCLWSPEGDAIATISPAGKFTCCAPLVNGNIAVGFDDNPAGIWSPAGERLATLEGHTGSMTCIDALLDGGVLTGSEDGTMRFWSPDGVEVRCIDGHAGPITDINVLPNGNVISRSDNGARLWSTSGELVEDFGAIRQLNIFDNGDFAIVFSNGTAQLRSFSGALLETFGNRPFRQLQKLSTGGILTTSDEEDNVVCSLWLPDTASLVAPRVRDVSRNWMSWRS